MKKLEAVIRSEKLKELAEKLRLAGIGGMMVSEIKGFGVQTTRPEEYLFLPKTKIEIYVTDAQVEEIIAVIVECCRTEKMGSGKVAVIPMEECVRIRTGDRGETAIF
ncbi:MAG: P-II family nitrogen regulator [Candidatus Omnitrophica bacterium]|nr:P-II family nitrogen regulator [Candidatus Omnitrophota bacterium]